MKTKYLIILLLVYVTASVLFLMVRLERRYLTPKIITIEKAVPEQIEIPATSESIDEKISKLDLSFRIEADQFQVLVVNDDGRGNKTLDWQDFFVKGVNLGAALPGRYPSEFAATTKDYLHWFKLMGEAGFNAVRVYTILPPEFYEALARYNFQYLKRRIWLIHGIWASMPEDGDYFNKKYTYDLKREIRNVIDVVFGHAVLPPRPGSASGTYITDVRDFTLGFIFGREWEPGSVWANDSLNSSISSFHGEFFSVPLGTPMEVWLAQMMDFLVKYETLTYGCQHPVSFVNWLPLDPMWHMSEFIESHEIREYDNDLLSIDPTNIYTTPQNLAGFYASYHVYPYYPDFILHDRSYGDYESRFGKDNFAGYLNDLKRHHMGMPLLIAEFGVPSSRGISHFNPHGLNQGGHTEKAQGQLDFVQFQDIYDEGCAGGILFSWLDEWFKRNWLVLDFEKPEERNKLWHNMQDPEQNYGLISFGRQKIRLDGNTEDWRGRAFFLDDTDDALDSLSDLRGLWADSDAEYLYVRIDLHSEPDWKTTGLIFALDTYDQELGDHKMPYFGLRSDNGTEFILHIEDTTRANLLVDNKYETFSNPYWKYRPAFCSESNSDGIFVEPRLMANRQRISLDGVVFPEKICYPGWFVYGHQDHNSLADWFSKDSVIEIRIPWNIINVTDPSSYSVLHDTPMTPEMDVTHTRGVAFSVMSYKSNGDSRILSDALPDSRNGKLRFTRRFLWETWEIPDYEERVKQSYYILKEKLKTLDSDNSRRSQRLRRPIIGDDVKVNIACFGADAAGAVSITFDDGTYTQYEYGLPILQKYDLSASFGLVSNWTADEPKIIKEELGLGTRRLGFVEARELLAFGNEISAHGSTHRTDLASLPEDSIFVDFRGAKQHLEKNLNVPILSLHYPYSQIRDKSERAARRAGYYTARIGGGTANDPEACERHRITGFVILNQTNPSLSHFRGILERSQGKWSVFDYHHIFTENSKENEILRNHNVTNTYALTPGTFERHMRMIRNSGLWVRPLSTVARYFDQREQANIVLRRTERSCWVSVEGIELAPSMHVPLTLKMTLPWEWSRVSGSLHDGIYQARNGEVLLEVMPEKEILIEKLEPPRTELKRGA